MFERMSEAAFDQPASRHEVPFDCLLQPVLHRTSLRSHFADSRHNDVSIGAASELIRLLEKTSMFVGLIALTERYAADIHTNNKSSHKDLALHPLKSGPASVRRR
ncbi:MAG: hypothetical protein AAF907_15925 [Planctomycetota bacterium]